MSKKDNRILNQECGRYPFKVADEYFDNLTARIMAQIPEESTEKETKVISIQRSRRNLWISTISIAASLVLVATIAIKFISLPSSAPIEKQTADVWLDNDYNEALMTYTMADNMDIYCYLAGGLEE
ncbi:MAG: hypothetical protein IKD25_03330 [Bacteroidaceae bacterium]|nr:hypothetical protein [Bacteroidaceae bacterium]